MKRILLSLLTVVLFSSIGFNALGQTAICQDVTLQLDANGEASLPDPLVSLPEVDVQVGPSNGAPENNNFWQSFIPTTSGPIDRIVVNAEQLNVPTGLVLSIYSGEGIGGTLLHSQAIASLIVGDNTLSLNTSLDLVAGLQYTFRLTSGAGTFYLQRNNTNVYADGISSLGANFDLVFSTYMLTPPSIDNGSSAAAGIASITISQNTFNCNDLGTVNVTVTVTDKNGNTDQCVAVITIEDNIAPVALCVAGPITLPLNVNGDATLLVLDVDNGSNDNCSFTSALSQSVFNCSDVGPNTITLTIEDIANSTATCNVQVDVVDTSAPDALCQNIVLPLDANGLASIVVGDINLGSTDACGIATYSLDITDFDCLNLGANTVVLSLEDVNGNSSSCPSTVTVVDNINPTISCAAPITLCATSVLGATVAFNAPVGDDNCDFVITQTDGTGLASGSTFPLGTTTLSYSIEDGAGNTNQCSFDITVDAVPVAGFNFSPACVGDAMFFNSTSSIPSGYAIVSWSWDMGDGSAPIGQVNPLYQFPLAGDYNVTLTVTSANGCEDVITQTVTVTPSPVANFTVAPVCLGATTSFVNTTSIDVSYLGALNYTWNFGDGTPSSTDENPVHTYATSGTFTATLNVVSDDGCTDQIQLPVLVSALPQAQFVASEECEGIATEFTDLSFGTGLTYDWHFGDGNSDTDQNPDYTYSASGSYLATLTVTAPGDCQSSITNGVNVVALPVVDFTFTPNCEGLSVAFDNNSDAGTYGWDFNDNSSSILSNPSHVFVADGFYDVTLMVLSSDACSASLTQSVEIYRNPEFTLTPTDVLCFGENTGSINILAVLPSTMPWEVSLNGAPSITDQDNFTDLEAGAYSIAIVDANGCTNTETVSIVQPSAPLALNSPTIIDLQCNEDNSGSIAIVASGGTAPYAYALSGGSFQSSGLFQNLAADDYYFEVIDANGCAISTGLFTINEPSALELDLVSFSNLLCNGDNSGELIVAASGGTAPYAFSNNGGAFGSSPSFNGLAAGDNLVLVEDANGCELSLSIELTEPGILMASVVNSEGALCFDQATGTVLVSAAAGTAPYQYSIDGTNFQGSGAFQGLGAGTYTITAQDANGCLDPVEHIVVEPSVLSMETTTSPVLCFGESTGTATVSAMGGTAPYTYSFDEGDTFINQNDVSGLPAGNYILVVRDENGCTASQGIQISEPATVLSVNGDVTGVLCLGEASGAIQLLADGGTPTYAYSSNGVVFQTSGQFSGFAAGSQTFYAQDLNGCVATVIVEFTEPSSVAEITNSLVNNPGCGLSLDGAITLIVSGGTPEYTYSSNGIDFQSSGLLTGLGVGEYTVVVRDANGCQITQDFSLVSDPPLFVVVNNVVGVECAGSFTGALELSGTGGTPEYSYSLSGSAPQISGSYSELTNGVYLVTLTDNSGCTATAEVEVPFTFPVPLVDFNAVVSGEAVLFDNTSEFGDSYLWDFGDGTTSTEENPVHIYATPGYYTVTLSVTNGCGTRTRTRAINTIMIGIEDAASTQFSVFPNPTAGVLNITTASDISGSIRIEITSVSGQRVMQMSQNGVLANGKITIDASALNQGMYYITIQTTEGRSVMRFNVIR